MSEAVFSDAQLHVVRWAAEECERQRSGEASVSRMVVAWQYAAGRAARGIDFAAQPGRAADRIIALGILVEPDKNHGNIWRKQRVGINDGTGHIGKWLPEPDHVPGLMGALIDALPSYAADPDDWYREFEEVHPFLDGNGRVGSILWNWMRGTLAQPEVPPDFWTPPPPRVPPTLARRAVALRAAILERTDPLSPTPLPAPTEGEEE